MKELQKSLTLKSRELEEKKTAANLKLKEMLADQQKVPWTPLLFFLLNCYVLL